MYFNLLLDPVNNYSKLRSFLLVTPALHKHVAFLLSASVYSQ